MPGYLKIREFEWLEAKNYALDRSVHMRDKIEQRIDTLDKAGVSDIPSYVNKSKGDMLREFETMGKDPRVIRFILNEHGVTIFDGSGDVSLEIQASIARRIDMADNLYFRYEVPGQNWMTTFQKQEDWGWYILSMMSEAEVYLDSKNYLLYVIGVSMLVLLLVLSLAILLTRELRLRAGSILGLLKQYGDGDYEERLQVTGPAELGDLQIGINSMIDHIEMEILSRKSIEDELNSARLEAEGINMAKAEYARDMRRQAQNTMNSARGFSELLLNTELDQKQKKYTNNVLEANQLLATLVSDLLALSGIEMEADSGGFVNADESETQRPCLKRLDILLVGVDPLNCTYFSEIVSGHGVTANVVLDESAAVNYLEEEDADLIVLDIDHSKLSSEESIAYMRNNMTAYAGSIPILIMTSKDDSLAMACCRRMDAIHSIRKPFSATRLLNVMSAVFQAQEREID